MDAHLTPPTSFPADSIDDPLSHIAKQVIALGAALVLFLCVVIVVRGLLGAFEAPASATFPVLAAATAEFLASAFRFVWSRLYPDATRQSTLLARLGIPSICVVCVAGALSMTGANVWAVGALWLVIAGSECAWWYPEVQVTRIRTTAHTERVTVEPQLSEDVDEEEELGANVIQQITRSRNEEGIEVITGVLRAEFAPGERTHNLHVAFCPPLVYEPRVVAHQLSGSPLVMKVAQSEIFGTRIELRLASDVRMNEIAMIYFEVQPA